VLHIRRSAVGGSWYPGDPARLAAAVDSHIAAAAVEPLPHPPRALIAPHAGLMYSGPVAAFAYKAARATRYRAVILIGPSHFVPFHGVAAWSEGTWETPFGPVAVDSAIANRIRAQSDEVIDLAAAHGREHSLEMQLPFVAHLMPGTPIVPLVMGHQTRRTAFALGDAIAAALEPAASGAPDAGDVSHRQGAGDAGGGEILLVASSDLSHYEDARRAAVLDAIVLERVEALDAEGLMSALEREPRHACGGGPMVTVLHAARQLAASSARVLRYADSGDVSGDKSAVVGYMAAAIW
jgi:predicted class III extradiol MEMO1 family dioxygenase